MELVIHPYEGIEIPGKGIICFGMTREQVRAFFDEAPHSFMATEKSEMPTDAFVRSSLQFSYKKSGLLRGVAISPRKQDPIFQSQHLLKTPYKQIEMFFKTIDPNLEIEEFDGITSHKFGISIWAPGADEEEPDYTAESVFVFERGYFDR
jgi:hypothetical protein